MPESPAWPVAAERIQDRERVGGEQRRAGKGPLGGKAGRSQQSLGRRAGPRRSSGENPGGGSLPLAQPRGDTPGGETPPEEAPSRSPTPEERPPEERPPEEAPSRSPTPEGANEPAESHPLPSLRLCASGWSQEHTSCFT